MSHLADFLQFIWRISFRLKQERFHREEGGGGFTDKKLNQIFLIYREIQSGAVAKSYMRKGFLIYEEMGKYFPVYEDAVSHI